MWLWSRGLWKRDAGGGAHGRTEAACTSGGSRWLVDGDEVPGLPAVGFGRASEAAGRAPGFCKFRRASRPFRLLEPFAGSDASAGLSVHKGELLLLLLPLALPLLVQTRQRARSPFLCVQVQTARANSRHIIKQKVSSSRCHCHMLFSTR